MMEPQSVAVEVRVTPSLEYRVRALPHKLYHDLEPEPDGVADV